MTDLADVLADILATPGIDPNHAYEVGYCRDQVRRHLPVIEGLVIAGVLHEAPERLALDQEAQAACRWWASALIRAITCRSPTLQDPGANPHIDPPRAGLGSGLEELG